MLKNKYEELMTRKIFLKIFAASKFFGVRVFMCAVQRRLTGRVTPRGMH